MRKWCQISMKYKLIKVDGKGNVTFPVYGYMDPANTKERLV